MTQSASEGAKVLPDDVIQDLVSTVVAK